MTDIDTVHDRIHQARACVDAIHVVLVDRRLEPDGSHMTDLVLEGLASAAGDLLRQANAAAGGESYGN